MEMTVEEYDKIVRDYENGIIPEIWKDVVGFEGIYQVSNYGRVKSLSTALWNGWAYFFSKERIKKQGMPKNGYGVYKLYKDGVCLNSLTHRIVAMAFIPNPENKEQVNHIRGIKNHNYPECLSWTTPSENMLHAHRTGLKRGTWLGRTGSKHSCSKEVFQFDKNGNLIGHYGSAGEASRATGISTSSICYCARGIIEFAWGYSWKYSLTA